MDRYNLSCTCWILISRASEWKINKVLRENLFNHLRNIKKYQERGSKNPDGLEKKLL